MLSNALHAFISEIHEVLVPQLEEECLSCQADHYGEELTVLIDLCRKVQDKDNPPLSKHLVALVQLAGVSLVYHDTLPGMKDTFQATELKEALDIAKQVLATKPGRPIPARFSRLLAAWNRLHIESAPYAEFRLSRYYETGKEPGFYRNSVTEAVRAIRERPRSRRFAGPQTRPFCSVGVSANVCGEP